MLHLEAEVHADVLHAGVDVGVEVHVADGGGAFEGSSEARHLETRHQLDCSVLQLTELLVQSTHCTCISLLSATTCQSITTGPDLAILLSPVRTPWVRLTWIYNIDIVDTRYYRY